MLAGTLDNLLLNGDFLPGLWGRTLSPLEGIECAVWRQTFAADRWKVRYARGEGAPVSQAMAADVPAQSSAPCSLELRGAPGVTQPVYFGQRIEAAEAVRYRGELLFSAWCRVTGSNETVCDIGLVTGMASEADDFGDAFNDRVKMELTVTFERVPTGRWVHLEHPIDARGYSANGLSIELVFAPRLLDSVESRVRVAGARLAPAGRTVARPTSMEGDLARRFFQRHDSTTINSLGRALVVNAHEMHFQFTFQEMRAFPACTLPGSEEGLRIFDLEGISQEGFTYDVTYRSRGSVIIRATKERHGLRDGYLSFVGSSGFILLDSEL